MEGNIYLFNFLLICQTRYTIVWLFKFASIFFIIATTNPLFLDRSTYILFHNIWRPLEISCLMESLLTKYFLPFPRSICRLLTQFMGNSVSINMPCHHNNHSGTMNLLCATFFQMAVFNWCLSRCFKLNFIFFKSNIISYIYLHILDDLGCVDVSNTYVLWNDKSQPFVLKLIWKIELSSKLSWICFILNFELNSPKRKIYENQNLHKNIAWCFHKIPIANINLVRILDVLNSDICNG